MLLYLCFGKGIFLFSIYKKIIVENIIESMFFNYKRSWYKYNIYITQGYIWLYDYIRSIHNFKFWVLVGLVRIWLVVGLVRVVVRGDYISIS